MAWLSPVLWPFLRVLALFTSAQQVVNLLNNVHLLGQPFA